MGSRAMYLYAGGKDTLYRIHGTNQPEYIGQAISSGCVRLTNEDVIDLYSRVELGTIVVVLDHRSDRSKIASVGREYNSDATDALALPRARDDGQSTGHNAARPSSVMMVAPFHRRIALPCFRRKG